MWDTLADAYSHHTLDAMLHLHSMIKAFKYDISQSAIHNIARIRLLGNRCAVAGSEYPDIQLIFTFLIALPHWLKPAVTALNGFNLTWDSVSSRVASVESGCPKPWWTFLTELSEVPLN